MRHCTVWILAKILCIVLVQLPTNTTSEYIQPKYNVVPKKVMISDLSFTYSLETAQMLIF